MGREKNPSRIMADAGDVLSFGAYVFGSITWKDDVDSLIKTTVTPVKSRAQAFADEFPFTIPGFDLTKLSV